MQKEIDAWLEAPDLDAPERIAAVVQRAALDQVPYIPSGLYYYRTAVRNDITGIIPGQFVFPAYALSLADFLG